MLEHRTQDLDGNPSCLLGMVVFGRQRKQIGICRWQDEDLDPGQWCHWKSLSKPISTQVMFNESLRKSSEPGTKGVHICIQARQPAQEPGFTGATVVPEAMSPAPPHEEA